MFIPCCFTFVWSRDVHYSTHFSLRWIQQLACHGVHIFSDVLMRSPQTNIVRYLLWNTISQHYLRHLQWVSIYQPCEHVLSLTRLPRLLSLIVEGLSWTIRRAKKQNKIWTSQNRWSMSEQTLVLCWNCRLNMAYTVAQKQYRGTVVERHHWHILSIHGKNRHTLDIREIFSFARTATVLYNWLQVR